MHLHFFAIPRSFTERLREIGASDRRMPPFRNASDLDLPSLYCCVYH
jgi:hypothetical protein